MHNTSFFSSSTPSPQTPSYIMDVDQNNFVEKVVNASQQSPVFVEFWAPWCQPCQHFTPQLERTIRTYNGRIRLAKLDIEKNDSLTAQLAQIGLPLQSIPLVAVFWQGTIHDLLQGVHSPSALTAFIDSFLEENGIPQPISTLLHNAQLAFHHHNMADALNLYSQILEQDAEHPAAWAGLIRSMIAMDDLESACAAEAQLPDPIQSTPEITQARAALALFKEGKAAAHALTTLRHAVQHHPDDYTHHIQYAVALNGTGQKEEAASILLHVIQHDRLSAGHDAKTMLLRFFDAWGTTDPLTIKTRRQLSSLLFS